MNYPYHLDCIREQVFVEINGYPNYFLSSFGTVTRKEHEIRRTTGDVHTLREITLVRYIDNLGYWTVDIKGNPTRLHRLLADHFIPNPENKAYVNHKDGDKLNLDLPNLEWSTPSENNQHAYDILGKIGSFTGKHSPISKSVMVKNGDKVIIGKYPSVLNASKFIDVHPIVINRLAKSGKRHRDKEYYFEYGN